jgi:hypothetical protein
VAIKPLWHLALEGQGINDMVRLSYGALLGLLPFAFAATRQFDLTVENKVVSPDGFARE